MKGSPRGDRFLAIAVMGVVLLTYPLMSLFDRGGVIAGIPMLYAYLFGVWIMLIVLLAIVAERP